MGLLTFENSFFTDEIISGFHVEAMMKRAWAAELEILKIIENICRKYGIKYYASYGTLLGAIRHKGFIPWDDDIDIYFTRKDWGIFFSHADELPSRFKVFNYTDESEYRNLCIRIVNEIHIPLQGDYLSYFHGFPYIAGIDIEILDNVSDDELDDAMQQEVLNIIIQTEAMLYVDNNNESVRNTSHNQLMENISSIESMCNIKLDYSQNMSVQLFKLFDNLSQIYNEEKTKKMQGTLYRNLYDRDCTFFSQDFEEVLEVPFECTTIWIPKGYKDILTKLYGDDYMTPKIGVSMHDYPSYRKQEEALKEYIDSYK